MQNGKVDNQLLLAVGLPEEERNETQELNVGYDKQENTWELIVKSERDLTVAAEQLGIGAPIHLRNGYTILRVPESRIEALSQIPEVEYIEKPKKLYFEVADGSAASCILPVQRIDSFPQGALTGNGVIVAVIDTGMIMHIRIFGMKTELPD